MNKHEKIKISLKIIGISLLVIGLSFACWGFIDFFIAFSSMDMPKYFWAAFVGLPLIGIGMMMTILGFKREIVNYNKNESMPIVKDVYQEIKPELKDIIKESKAQKVICPKCGKENEPEDKYCSNCGHKL